MSRIGKAPIEIPAGVTVTVKDNVVTVKGPKGELSQQVNPDLTVKVEDGHVVVTRPSDDREHRAQHGLYRALIHNMVVGVSTGYRKEMELVGVGYRCQCRGPGSGTLARFLSRNIYQVTQGDQGRSQVRAQQEPAHHP